MEIVMAIVEIITGIFYLIELCFLFRAVIKSDVNSVITSGIVAIILKLSLV